MSLGVTAVSVGDKFPTTPVVHVGFPKAKTIAELLEGKSKVLFVSLPGAFTPT
jgi:peroxiredoxin